MAAAPSIPGMAPDAAPAVTTLGRADYTVVSQGTGLIARR